MKFFNKKEDVLEIQLTQYGKHLLSLGELKPAYYAFYDDDVLYDSDYAGSPEEQNETQTRIEEETPSLRVQHVYSGRETAVVENNTKIRSGAAQLRDKAVQQTPDRDYALSYPIGTSDLGSDHQPSWYLSFMSGEIESVSDMKVGAHANKKIPQIDIGEITWKTTNHRSESGNVWDEFESEEQPTNNFRWTPVYDFPDGTFVALEGDDIILEIDETNVPFLNENFEIEVFLVENVDERGRVVEPAAAEGKETLVERLTPLYWHKEHQQVQNGLLVDEIPNPNFDDASGPAYVGHFLAIEVDGEIMNKRMCEVLPKKKTSDSIHTHEHPYHCPEKTEGIDRAVHGLYDPVYHDADGPFGEDC